MGERVRLGSGGVTVRAALPAGLTLLLTVALVFAFGVLRATDARASVVLFEVVSSSVQFTDIGSSPYKTAIEALASAQIINGYADGTFRPDDPVIRQQFAKMIVLSLGLTVKLTDVCPFADVVDGGGVDPLYPAHYVAVCASNKITEGKSPGRFDPMRTSPGPRSRAWWSAPHKGWPRRSSPLRMSQELSYMTPRPTPRTLPKPR